MILAVCLRYAPSAAALQMSSVEIEVMMTGFTLLSIEAYLTVEMTL